MSDQPRVDVGPVGVTFFEQGGTVFYKNVLDARSAVGPRVATQDDADRYPAEFEAAGVSLPKDPKASDRTTDPESERLKHEAAVQQASADQALAADKARQAKLDAEDADNATAAADEAAKKADEAKTDAEKAEAERQEQAAKADKAEAPAAPVKKGK